MMLQPIEATPIERAEGAAITDEEAAALARATVNLFRAWKLSDAEATTLLGGLSTRTWARWKEGNIGRIDRDLRMRMAHLMGIHKGLRYLYRDVEQAYRWVKKPNAMFAGQRALDVMLGGSIFALQRVRAYLDAERGGW